MEHPLADIIDRIDPTERYRIPDLAELLDLPASSTTTLAFGGWFGEAEWERVPGADGRRKVWTGAALIEAIDSEPPPLDHTRYTPSTLWRLGCGCDDCLTWHNTYTRNHRRARSDKAFPEQRRRQVLELVSAGDVASVQEAAERAGVTVGQVYGLARRDEEFGKALDAAGEALCVDPGGPLCGRPAAYRSGCRGTACRRAHTGTADPVPSGADTR